MAGELTKCLSTDRHVTCAAVTAAGKTLVTCSGKTAFAWNVDTFALQGQFNRHGSPLHKKDIRACAVSHDDLWLATAADDGRVV